MVYGGQFEGTFNSVVRAVGIMKIIGRGLGFSRASTLSLLYMRISKKAILYDLYENLLD